MSDITQERWNKAQTLENSFWQGSGVSLLLKAAGLFAGIVETLGQDRCTALFDDKDILDVGSGPWALNLGTVYWHAERIKRWAVAEPLPRIPIRSVADRSNGWADGFLAWLEQRLARVEYLQVSGEALQFDAAFDTVTCINVLDHVRQPQRILQNIRRALRPNGRLLLGVDCLSVAGQIKFDWYLRRRHPNSFIVGAHPFTFRVEQMRRMLTECDFKVDKIIGGPSRSAALYGRAHHPFFLCRV